MSKTITISDKTYKLIKDQVEKDNQESSKTKIQIKTLAGEVLYESEKTTIRDAVVEAVGADADLGGAYLRGAYLVGTYLRGADFGDADLRGVDFGGADLRGVNLRDADLRGADFADVDLRGANLADADFYQTKFYGRGGTTRIKKNQVDDFFKALGVIVEE